MDAPSTEGPGTGLETVNARFSLRMPGGALEAEVAVPTGPTRVGEILPLAQSLADRLVALALNVVEAEGRRVSCCAGCGACCRQLVPIAEAEARRLRELVAEMPEPRRSEVRARFDAAIRRFEAAGLLDDLRRVDMLDNEGRRRLGLDYFAQGVACPFLEDESCSIHPDRPISCREYLVTSPAERCAHPEGGGVVGVELPTHVWTAVARFDPPRPGASTIRWLPLVLALEWADAHPDEPAPRPGTELVRELVTRIARPGPEPPR